MFLSSIIYIIVFKLQTCEMQYRKQKRKLVNEIREAENFGIKSVHPDNTNKNVGKNSTKHFLGLLAQ